MGIAVSSMRLAYVIVGESDFILDYAIWDFRYHDRRLLWPGIKALIEQFKPRLVCTQNLDDPECKLGEHAHSVVSQIVTNLPKAGVANRAISKGQVRDTLGLNEKATKQDIAERLAAQHPDVAFQLPAKRKDWEAEHRNMILFVTLGLTCAGKESGDVKVIFRTLHNRV